MLTAFGQDLYFADGPAASFYGFPYPTRMAVVRLSSGKTWVWSPNALTEDLGVAGEAVGDESGRFGMRLDHFAE